MQKASQCLGRHMLCAIMIVPQPLQPFPCVNAERAQVTLPVVVDAVGQWSALLHHALS